MDRKMHFLLVDDDDVFIYLTKNLILRSGLASEITTKNSSIESISWLHERVDRGEPLPDIIFLDIRMPVMNGLDFIRMFHSIPEKAIEKTKICMLSSSLNPEEKTAAMSYKNVLRYFEKPLKKEALIELTVALQAER